MKAAKDTVITLHYDLSTDGEAVESSRKGEPMQVLLGRGFLIKGLEDAIDGHDAGDTFKVELSPEQGYGERRENAIQRVPRKYFVNGKKLKPGMTTVLALKEGGQRAVTVHKVGMSTIDVDINHPMAGKSLSFDIELVDVREATPEEIEHGHVHGPDTPEH
ncbi:MAG TPA: peptidylprolyl isomerase [Rhodanobacteraceae bacterium]|nr:peptidylprolyl isomerase [Rhodanobacteraceae bacterium]